MRFLISAAKRRVQPRNREWGVRRRGASSVLILSMFVTSLLAGPFRQDVDDPALKAAVEQFFATQQAEDVDAYLALWSSSAARPRPEQLKYVFENGDDTFSEISIVGTRQVGDRLRVRVSATRDRNTRVPQPGAPAFNRRSQMLMSLTYVREDGEWKLVHEGPAVDELATDLVDAQTPEELERLFSTESDLLTEDLVLALGRHGSQASQQMAYHRAQIIYERMLDVARRIGHPRFEGEALQNLANIFYFRRDFQRAFELYEQRLAIERERGDDASAAAALSGMGTVRYAAAEYGAALGHFRSALAIQEALGDDAAIGTTLIGTGNVLYLQGDYVAAIADYRRSREIAKRISNWMSEAMALEGLGRVYMVQGDLAGALDAFSAVLAERVARNDRNGQGTALMSVGEVHFRLGNLDVARARFEESRSHFEALKDLANAGRSWQAIALTDLVAGRPAAAEQEYVRSTAACDASQDRECVAAATVGLAFAQATQDKFPEAIRSYQQAIERFTALNRREQIARAEIGLAQALSGSGDYKGAIAAAGRARHASVVLSNDDLRWRALTAEARALRRAGAREQALGAARAAIYAVDQLQETARVRPGNPVPRDSAGAFAILAVLQAEAGDAAAAFETIERLRIHDLRTVLGPAEREITRGMTPEERDEEREAAVGLVSLHAQLTREKGLPRPDEARIQMLERNIADAAANREAQQQRLFTRVPELRTWRGLVAPATTDDLQAILDPDTALLELVVDEEDVVVIAARRGAERPEFTAQVAPLTRRALVERLGQMLQPDILKDAAGWKRAAAEFKIIPASIAERLDGATHVVVVPHDILWRVPFEALPVGQHYFADAAAISYASSVTALIRPPVVTGEQSGGLLAVASPEISAATRDRLAQTAPGWTLRSLELAEREVRAIADDLDSERVQLLTGAAATEAALRARLPESSVLHLTGPFRVNGASPLFSPVLLATSQIGSAQPSAEDDGALEAREVINLETRARVAVVSDGSALSMRDAAHEAGAVQWAWRAAGVPSLILARWMADNPAGNALVQELHQHLRQSYAPHVALNRARASVRAKPQWSAPYYWAGWLLIGGR
jgi:tetratricopeptide (TPR) repeat protein